MEAVPASGTAPSAGPDADLFNAVLGQMMGQDDVALGGAPANGAIEASLDRESEASADTDPTELVNPLFIEGAAPAMQLAPVATLVWTIPAAAATSSPAFTAAAPTLTEFAAAPLAEATESAVPMPDAFAAVDSPAGMPSPIDTPPSSIGSPAAAADVPLDLKAGAPSHETHARAAAPRLPNIEGKPAAAAEAPLAAPVDPAALPESAERKTRAEFAPEIADAISRHERPSRAAKNEKAPVEPRIDPAGIRPLPFVAVERAYAGNEAGTAKSFDAPKEQAPFANPSSSPAPAAVPAFVVPVDGRSMPNAPAAAVLETVDIPAAMARDIDTHVPGQIVQSIRLQAHNGGGEAIIRLNPGYLGEVVVAVKVEQGNVFASLQAETPAVRQWAERNESVLRQALAEQGLQLDKLTVAEKASESEREGARDEARDEAREEHSQQQPRRRRPQSDEATFEVTV